MSAFKCIHCGGKTDTTDTRFVLPLLAGKWALDVAANREFILMRGVRRRRTCRECGNKFTTYEISQTHYNDLAAATRAEKIKQAKQGKQ